jgi:Mechanosensitive ion channel
MRRPYDLGDRIMIVASDVQDKTIPNESFFVEDINLLTTTVRYAASNEVSTINNFSISNARIINLNRSPNACLDFEMRFQVSVLSTGKHLQYRTMLEQYVADHPRIWDSLIYMRHDEFDTNYEYIIFRFSFRHCSSWQNAGRIMIHHADLVRIMYEKGAELQIL